MDRAAYIAAGDGGICFGGNAKGMKMSKNKWTPGLWKARIEETCTIRDSRDNQLAIFTHLHTRTGGRRDSDEVAANCRIAAVSPVLYAALKALYQLCCQLEADGLSNAFHAALADTHDVLVLARGETIEGEKSS